MDNYDLSQAPGAPRLPGTGPARARIFERALECLGSKFNDEVSMIADVDINAAKSNVSFFTTSSLLHLIHYHFFPNLLTISLPISLLHSSAH